MTDTGPDPASLWQLMLPCACSGTAFALLDRIEAWCDIHAGGTASDGADGGDDLWRGSATSSPGSSGHAARLTGAGRPVISIDDLQDGTWAIEVICEARDVLGRLHAALTDARSDQSALFSDVDLRCAVLSEVPQRDWVAHTQSMLRPVRAGRFIVHGSHDRQRVAPSRFAIEIDAQRAFGTAHHPTTVGCLRLIDRLGSRTGVPPMNLLDLGTGSGILAIAAARVLPRARILATDIDPVALAIAQDNVRLNGVARAIRCAVADGLDHAAIRAAGPFDVIIANILARPLAALAPDLVAQVRPGGCVLLSGILASQSAWVEACYRAAGAHHLERIEIDGWSTLVMRVRGRT